MNFDADEEEAYTPENQTHAIISSEAYKNEQNRAQTLEGYNLDASLGNKYSAVYVRPGDNDTIVAFRGTKDYSDIAPDLDIAMGRRSHPRFREADELVGRVESKYNKKAKLTGHSLGGTVADYVSQRRGNNATVFNPGSNPFLKEKMRPSLRVHRDKGDLISGGYARYGQEGSIAGTLLGHGLARFLGRRRNK